MTSSPFASRSEPSETRHGVGELVRTWTPADDPWARCLLIHGIAEHSGRYEEVGAAMAAAGISVRGFDLVGFGASGGRRGHIDSWTHYLDQVEDNLSAFAGTGPLVLFGHSMGGLLALEYVLSDRPGVAALVLRAPALAGGAAWQRLAAPIFARLTPHLPMPQALKGSELSRDPAVGEAYFADPLVYTKGTPRLGLEIFDAMDRVTDHVARLSVSTLVLHGGADTIVPPASTAVLGTLPTVERRLLVGLRHEPHMEPEGPEIIADVISWIESEVGDR